MGQSPAITVNAMTYHYHDETIIKNLPENTVFVFGSNLAGTHQGGAAKIAHLHFGATKGVGRGWAGQSFAIPTMNEHLQQNDQANSAEQKTTPVYQRRILRTITTGRLMSPCCYSFVSRYRYNHKPI